MIDAHLLALLATTIEMTTCFICARQLWRLRKDVKDSSRWLLALGSWLCGLLSALAVIGNAGMIPAPESPQLLQPWAGLVYMSLHIVMTMYPITVVRPDWLNPLHYFFLFLPVAVFFIGYLFFIGQWTFLETPQDIRDNILRPDVLVRLASLFVMVPYCFILFLLPYNRRQSSASFRWIILYSLGLSIICGIHIVLMLSYNPVLLVVLPLMASTFYFFSTEYELGDRLRPSLEIAVRDGKVLEPSVPGEASSAADASTGNSSAENSSAGNEAPEGEDLAQELGLDEEDLSPEFGLWTRVRTIIRQEEAWRDPDLTLISLAHQCGTNVTYLNHILREETGKSFKELINGKRIACVVAQLQKNPDMDIQEAFFNAGYRSRATAWRNFKEIMQVTPTEFRESLRH